MSFPENTSDFFSQRYYTDYYDNPYGQREAEDRENMTINFLKAFKGEDCSDTKTVESPCSTGIESTLVEMEDEPIDVLVKPRIWAINELEPLKTRMEPFLEEHLSKIQKVALESSSTVHFGKKMPFRTPGLEKLAHLESQCSFRVTRTGDVWILFKKTVNKDHNVRCCYSPTLGIFGVKKAIDADMKEKYEFLSNLNQLIEASNKESPIIPILDIALVPLKKFKDPDSEENSTIEESDKYSMITPKFDFALTDVIEKQFTCIQDVKKYLYCFNKSICLWTDLIKNYRIIHPDFNAGNIVFSLNKDGVIDKEKLIDFDEFKGSLPFLVPFEGNQIDIINIPLKYLDPSIVMALKWGLDTIFSHSKDCIKNSLILAEKTNYFSKESVELKNLARELLSSLNILVFGPLYLNFENDSNWLTNIKFYLKNCSKEITDIESNGLCIVDILERANSFVRKTNKLIT